MTKLNNKDVGCGCGTVYPCKHGYAPREEWDGLCWPCYLDNLTEEEQKALPVK